ncbi:hypothetical protein ACH5RR_038200 [Cinchona calisaya]|uniref:Patellin-4 n=1 Tax=Cinchona calisaya TaxID=153742 RepID=A0ABD2Y8E7_9GENT
MVMEAKLDAIKTAHVDASQEPAEDIVKANEAAEEECANKVVHDEMHKHNEPKTEEDKVILTNEAKTEEEKVILNATSPEIEDDKVGENDKGASSTEDKSVAKDNVDDVSSLNNGNANEEKQGDANEASSSATGENGDDSKPEESDPLSDLKENEKKALEEFRSKIEEAILTNKLFKEKQREKKEDSDQKAKSNEEEYKISEPEEQQKQSVEVDKGKAKVEDEAEEEKKEVEENGYGLWGVPLMPIRGDKGTDVILLKFLKAREFKVNDAFEMLRSTLQWRKLNNIDSILEEDFGNDYESMSCMSGVDRRGHPVCYNVYGVFGNDDLYNKTFGTQEGRERFLRWRLQLMERQIQKLDFRPEGVSSLLQINDLKDAPGPSRKDLRVATRQAVALLQDNYPEFVARNIFINVPFWYYAFNALLSPFLTQRTKSKFVFARANRVTETLLKYIPGEEIPVKYGGLKQENDPDFSTNDGVSDVTVKAGSSDTIEFPVPEAGSTLIWDLTVIGWEINYKEEFVPSDDSSYTIIVKKERRIGWQEGSVRNSFKNSEPGKVVITIENGQFKRKRVLYRFKIKDANSS